MKHKQPYMAKQDQSKNNTGFIAIDKTETQRSMK